MSQSASVKRTRGPKRLPAFCKESMQFYFRSTACGGPLKHWCRCVPHRCRKFFARNLWKRKILGGGGGSCGGTAREKSDRLLARLRRFAGHSHCARRRGNNVQRRGVWFCFLPTLSMGRRNLVGCYPKAALCLP